MRLDGNKVANELKDTIKKRIKDYARQPHLVVILVGDDPASVTYVNSKKRQCENVGMKSTVKVFDSSISQEFLLEEIDKLNRDEMVDGILVQLPLPNHINSNVVVSKIDVNKDVDGLHPLNVGLLVNDKPNMIPCTPKGIISILDYYDIELEGKSALVIGRSQLVGKPIASLLLSRNATVTIAHSKTQNLSHLVENNDIIVVAVGIKEFLKEHQLNSKHIVIDVGIHREGKKLLGDVERSAYDKVKAATPVPGGVGPMTIASLLENTLIAYERKEGF